MWFEASESWVFLAKEYRSYYPCFVGKSFPNFTGESRFMVRMFTPIVIPHGTTTWNFDGEDARYINDVMRMKIGEEILLCDASRMEYVFTIQSAAKKEVSGSLSTPHRNENEPMFRAILYQGVCKGERMDLSVQKSVELGATTISPLLCSRCIAKLEEGKTDGKIDRLQKIALEAARQSGRAIVPTVCAAEIFRKAILSAKERGDLMLIPWEEESEMPIGRILDVIDFSTTPGVSIFIGPEGGFSEEEVRYACENGAKAVTLGKRILRTETAGAAVLAMLVYKTELL